MCIKQEVHIFNVWTIIMQSLNRERNGSVVECLTRYREATGLILTSVTALCPWARHINPSLVLIHPFLHNWKIVDGT